jgi:hypothetical protein
MVTWAYQHGGDLADRTERRVTQLIRESTDQQVGTLHKNVESSQRKQRLIVKADVHFSAFRRHVQQTRLRVNKSAKHAKSTF